MTLGALGIAIAITMVAGLTLVLRLYLEIKDEEGEVREELQSQILKDGQSFTLEGGRLPVRGTSERVEDTELGDRDTRKRSKRAAAHISRSVAVTDWRVDPSESNFDIFVKKVEKGVVYDKYGVRAVAIIVALLTSFGVAVYISNN